MSGHGTDGGREADWSRPLSRRGGALLLAALACVVALVVGASHLLTPVPLPLGTVEVPEPGATCESPGPPAALVTSTTLHTCPEAFDGRMVTVAGEAIGDLLGTGPRRWVQVNDDRYAWVGPLDSHHVTLGANTGVAVLLPAGVRPGWLGGPDVLGDRLLVVGRFATAAEEDQGGPAVIADRVELIATGMRTDPRPSTHQRVVAVVVVVVAGGLVVAERVQARRDGRLSR